MSENEVKEKKPIYKKWWFWLIIVVIIIGIGAGTQSNPNTLETSGQALNQQQTINNTVNKEEKKPDVPKEYQNALKQAENYSKLMHMSKQGIYDQLTSEYGGQFEADAAQYAIDNVNADWKENALEQAKSYQDNMSMSKSAIYNQLTSEYGGQFTAEEAQYAIDHLDD